MGKMQVVRPGFQDKRKTFKPPTSPDGFEWPGVPTHEHKRAFKAALHEEMEKRGMDHVDLGKAITGEIINGAGFRTARSPTTARNWVEGKNFPRVAQANVLACYFDVPLARLVEGASKTNGKGNGHDHGTATSAAKKMRRGPLPLPPRLPLPTDANGPVVKLETFAADPRFVSIFITGTLQLDVALSVMALVAPREEMHELDPGE